MQINFISLFEIIRAVVSRIEISESELNYYSETPIDETPFAKLLAQASAKQCFGISRVAASLLQCLINTPAAPPWFDKALTGFPLQSEEAKKEGRDELVRLANEEHKFKANFERDRHVPSRWLDSPPIEPQEALFLDLPKLQRTRSIGFDRFEITNFLDKNNIPHTLASQPENLAEKVKSNELFAAAEVKSGRGVGIPTPGIAAAFARLGGWDEQKWSKYLSEASWARKAQTKPGRPGKGGAALWDPVHLAQLAIAQRGIRLGDMAKVFRQEKVLHPWLEEWKAHEEHERWYSGKNPLDKP